MDGHGERRSPNTCLSLRIGGIIAILCKKISMFSERVLCRMNFEWDDDKERINIQKHHIDFETKIFNDINRIEIYDWQHSETEDRYNTIGMVGDVLFVVYTERRERIRLISARLATEAERKLYYGDYENIKW